MAAEAIAASTGKNWVASCTFRFVSSYKKFTVVSEIVILVA